MQQAASIEVLSAAMQLQKNPIWKSFNSPLNLEVTQDIRIVTVQYDVYNFY